ncbi:hypothetical protein ACJJTC_009505 [Scirpophaga incertulas]
MISLTRNFVNPQRTGLNVFSKFVSNSAPIIGWKHATEQIDYFKTAIENNKKIEWPNIKKNILQIPGSITQKNIDAVLLKTMVNSRNFEAALSFSKYLKSTDEELDLGAVNGILLCLYELSKTRDLTPQQKSFIVNSYTSLYKKYNILDSSTCERLLHCLCSVKEWQKALKVLDNISFTTCPTHSAYSTLVAMFFDLSKKREAVKMIQKSVNDNRPLQTKAYEAWISYILRKYKDSKTMLKYMEEICLHIKNNSAVIEEDAACKITEVYNSLGWSGNITRIRKNDGKCMSCHEHLECLTLSEDEFQSLQSNIKDKLIVGSDILLKTVPEELEKFLKFIKSTAPYDIVIDSLNISYVARNGTYDKLGLLSDIVDYFVNQNKKVLLIGRRHMLHWNKPQLRKIMSKTCSFFIENVSQDDPYFITAALLSGSNTDFVSKDLLRGHIFNLQDEQLQLLFRRWQWQHQWMVFINRNKKIVIQPPLQFTPCIQKNNGIWHIPFAKKEERSTPQVNDGTPDLSSWICLKPDC